MLISEVESQREKRNRKKYQKAMLRKSLKLGGARKCTSLGRPERK